MYGASFCSQLKQAEAHLRQLRVQTLLKGLEKQKKHKSPAPGFEPKTQDHGVTNHGLYHLAIRT
jgi:hypothetical protein